MACTVVLITGCSSGIGLHLAIHLALDPSQSFKVYATLRDLKTQGRLWEAARALACPQGSLERLQLDVRNSSSLATAQERVTKGRVDVLVCNTGLGLLGPLGEDAVASVLDVNVVGTVRVLQDFLPDMKRRGSGRVLVTGSMGGLMGDLEGHCLPGDDPLAAAKFALEGLCESLAVLLLPFGVHSVSLIECGPVDTAFMQKVLGGPDQVMDRTNTRTFRLFKEIYREEAQHPEEVVKVFLTAMRAPKPTLRYFTTRRFLHQLLMRLDDPFGFDYAAAMHRDVFADDPAEAEAGAEAGGGAGGMGDPELSDPLAAPQERLRQPLSPAPSFVSWACAVPGDGTAVAAVDG
uniref:17-beta-estradiol 17-dehydrogenase n=1 Tax=Pan paniscus TaxID=9597 RepID=A0A2R9B606_PANPA